MGFSKSNSKRKVYNNTILPQETRKKISSKQPNLTPKTTRERRTNKTWAVSRRKEIIKMRTEINEIRDQENMHKDQ